MTDTIDRVLTVVAGRLAVSEDDIKSARRTRQVLPARHLVAYLAHAVQGMSPRDIGSQLGRRDYTIIEMYCRAVVRRAAEDDEFRGLLRDLETVIRARDY